MDLSTAGLGERLRQNLTEPVWIAGRGTRRPCPRPMTTVSAPSGILSLVPDEMTVSCGAGTPVDALMEELAHHGQYVNLPVKPLDSGTVGGALAVGEGDVHRLGRGSVRDVLLQSVVVRSSGEIFVAGGPTVKNVSGFDLCRLLVGSCGRLGILAEVILRTRPKPLAKRWLRIEACEWDTVSTISRQVHRPSALLWSGTHAHLCLEGHPLDISETTRHLTVHLARPVIEEEPDLASFPHRWVRQPSDIPNIVGSNPGSCLAEVGTGVIHHRQPDTNQRVDQSILVIEKRLLVTFDPSDRLNGGTSVWGHGHVHADVSGAS